MAVTQYIGARYVPIFYTDQYGGNDWEAGVQYEPLTIVTYLNQSYTSKKQVPAYVSNPADEPDYWVLTGAYNAQVAQLAQDVDDMQQMLEELTRQHYLIIGDSLSLGSDNTIANGFLQKAVNILDLSSDDYYLSAVGGAGFTAGTTFEDQLDTAISNVSDVFKLSPVRVIVVSGMHNDETNGATYLTAVDSFVSKVRANFANASIEMLPIAWSRQQSRRLSLRQFYEGYVLQLPDHGIFLWTDLYAWMHNYTDWYRDNIHPSSTGIGVLGKALAGVMLGNFNPNPGEGLKKPSAPQNIDSTLFSAMTSFTSIREYYDGKMVWLFSFDTSFFTSAAGGVTFSTSVMNPTKCCDNPFRYLGSTPYQNGRLYGEIPCYLRYGTDMVPATMVITDDDKLGIYTQNTFTVAGSLNIELKYISIGIPKENC